MTADTEITADERRTILVVDDTPANLSVLLDALKNRGYRLLVARDGESALERARYAHPDLILLDVMMPGMDGIETCARLKADEQLREIPVIFTTALADSQSKVRGLQAGGVDYITKPFQAEEVLARVQVHLALRAAHQRLQAQNAQLEEARSILEQRVAERTAELRRSRDMLAALFNGVADGLMLLDRDGAVQAHNPALVDQLGLAGRPLVGRLWADLRRDQPALEALAVVDEALESVGHDYERVRLVVPGLPPRMLDVHTIPLGGGSASDGLIVHIADVTQQLQLEARVVESERFAASGRLAASVAHEINTPLQSVQSFLYLLQDAAEEQRGGFLTLAQQELERVARILRQLLELYRPSAAAAVAIDVNTLLDRVLMLSDQQLARYRIQIERRYEPGLPPTVARVDELMQVWSQLIANAIQAMPEGGTITVATRSQRDERGAWVVVELSDTGVGIRADMLARIFEPFYTTRDDGLGLGLSISRQIVEAYGGAVAVVDTSDTGATFQVRLPARDPQARRAAVDSPQAIN